MSLHGEQLDLLQRQIDEIQGELEVIESNLALASNQAVFRAIEQKFTQKQTDLESLKAKLAQLPPATDPSDTTNSVAAEVEAALALFDDLSEITQDRDARTKTAEVLKRMDLKLGLRFMDNPRAKRPKRVVQGGLVTIGPGQQLFEEEACDGDHPSDADDGIQDLSSPNAGKSPPTTEKCQIEGRSLRKETGGKRAGGRCATRFPPDLPQPVLAIHGSSVASPLGRLNEGKPHRFATKTLAKSHR